MDFNEMKSIRSWGTNGPRLSIGRPVFISKIEAFEKSLWKNMGVQLSRLSVSSFDYKLKSERENWNSKSGSVRTVRRETL